MIKDIQKMAMFRFLSPKIQKEILGLDEDFLKILIDIFQKAEDEMNKKILKFKKDLSKTGEDFLKGWKNKLNTFEQRLNNENMASLEKK